MKMTRRSISLLLAAFMIIALIAGCDSKQPTPTPTPTPSDKPSGTSQTPSSAPSEAPQDVFKSVRIGVSYDPNTFDPAELNLDSSYAAAYIIYEALLRDVNGTVGPGLAETWEHNADMTEWTFRLRDSKYSDGTPITAEDIRYAIMRTLDPAAGHGNAAGLLTLKNANEYFEGTASAEDVGVKVLDAKTLKLTYANPVFEYEFTSFSYAPLKKDFVEPLGIEYGSSADKVICSGPFTLKEWVADSSFTLVKNENYWDAASIEMDEIKFLIGGSGNDTAVDMMLTDELDITYFTTMNQVNSLADAGFSYQSITSSYRCLNLNHQGASEAMKPFMNNVNFRKAINLAIDREALCASVLTTDTPAYRLTAPSEKGVEKAFNEEYPYQAWPTRADPTEAKRYLQIALDEFGKTVADVPPLVLLCFESQSSVTILSAVQDMLRNNLGLESEISSQTIGNMIAMAFGGEYDLWLGGNATTVPDWHVGFAQSYHSTGYAGAPGLRGYNKPEFDTLYNKVSSSTDYKARKDALFELEKFMCEDVFNIIVSWTNTYYVHNPDITNVYYRANGDPYYAFLDIKS
jgi:oligopeptide transport system substrate-binding protein